VADSQQRPSAGQTGWRSLDLRTSLFPKHGCTSAGPIGRDAIGRWLSCGQRLMLLLTVMHLHLIGHTPTLGQS